MAVAVALVAVASISLLSSRSATVGFREYTTKDEKINLERIRGILAENYERHGAWKDVHSWIIQQSNF